MALALAAAAAAVAQQALLEDRAVVLASMGKVPAVQEGLILVRAPLAAAVVAGLVVSLAHKLSHWVVVRSWVPMAGLTAEAEALATTVALALVAVAQSASYGPALHARSRPH